MKAEGGSVKAEEMWRAMRACKQSASFHVPAFLPPSPHLQRTAL